MYSAINTTARQSQINEYYIQQYRFLTEMYVKLIYALIILIVATLLNRIGILPDSIFSIIFIAVVAIAVIYALYMINSYLSRSNIVFTQFNWKFSPASGSDAGNAGSGTRSSSDGVCYNSACCGAGQVWNKTIAKCVVN